MSSQSPGGGYLGDDISLVSVSIGNDLGARGLIHLVRELREGTGTLGNMDVETGLHEVLDGIYNARGS